jgi:endonuclease-3 related protein
MTTAALKIQTLYDRLFAAYGPQGWWPVEEGSVEPVMRGYHPRAYSIPGTSAGRWEVAVGAVLTQNTSWQNVEKALACLKQRKLFSMNKMLAAPTDILADAVRSSGYFNQKAKKLKNLAALLTSESWVRGKGNPERQKLLDVWGIGPETADSILLYAFHQPWFVVDAYTRRLLSRLGWIEATAGYDEIQELFQRHLPRRAIVYNEYHALIVAHGKAHCLKNPICAGCPVVRMCRYAREQRSK